MPVEDFFPEEEIRRTFLLARGRAIESYAAVEQSLAALFAHLMGVPPDYAGVPFFKLNNARARNSILDRLLRKRYDTTYNIFFNSLIKQHLRPIDERRNQIVHWASVANVFVNEGGETKVEPSLDPPNYWDRTGDTPKIYLRDLYGFILKCYFLSRLLNMFVVVISGQLATTDNLDVKAVDATWREIFQQPIIYPPPNSHPLYQKP